MVKSCVAYGCTNRWKSGSGITFHTFPLKDQDQLQKWLKAIRREGWFPTQYSYICSEHFLESDFIQRTGICKRLKQDAVPSVFPAFPKHLQNNVAKWKLPKERKTEPSPTKIRKTTISDHCYTSTEASTTEKVKTLSKKVHALNQHLYKRNKRIKNMTDLIKQLKEKSYIAEKQADLLEFNFNGMAKELFTNQMNNPVDSHYRRYTDETKQFAMTLHYYSPKAYNFVRNLLSLPHPASICAWAASVECEPGYLMNVIKLVGQIAAQNKYMSEAVLVVDAMAIHKGAFWDRKLHRFVGCIDYGVAIPEPSDTPATEALVFLVVGITGHWKHPIAYVLQDHCSACVQAQLIKDCISLLHKESVNVRAVVFDGTYTNQSTAQQLGCRMKVSCLQAWFPHPELANEKVHIIFDACHMLKLMRNVLADYGTISHIVDGRKEDIKWEYIVALNDIQEDLGLSFANKLKRKHVDWTKHKMKVNLAAQTLSASVAAAIDFLRDEVCLPQFQGSEATTTFIRTIDDAFGTE